ncbi:conserved hypothetical protein [Neospora caninum Liverpool]|uniref:Transmembrane surface antigen TSA1 n=1 Tax=Neospora caninum (strain Liverpool) TaxID=572307 RepID=F0VN23_NEOCL|nr:conserved hypothetical protein [Neospora caninum Liverpool]CBZ55119.1 conserved hypothetical protein [Neospora caninum Liverpool]CEL69845.1 TPA: transmembrane surface antigen TSA1 [Neospora caninum Liverpool]|eukprot:XP_003885147.1 conserved hypothetical protein [Neospora caninum Liverpool]
MLCVEVLELLLYSCLHECCCCGRGGSAQSSLARREDDSQAENGGEAPVIYGADEDGCPYKQIRNILVVSLCDGGIVAAAVSSSHTQPFAAKALSFPPWHFAPACMIASENGKPRSDAPPREAVSPEPKRAARQRRETEHVRHGPIESQHSGAQTVAALLASLYDEFVYVLSDQPAADMQFCYADGSRCPIRCPRTKALKRECAACEANGTSEQQTVQAPHTCSCAADLESGDELPVLVVSCDRDKAAVGPFCVREGELPPEEEARRYAQAQREREARRQAGDRDRGEAVQATGAGAQVDQRKAGESGADFAPGALPGRDGGHVEDEAREIRQTRAEEDRDLQVANRTVSEGAEEGQVPSRTANAQNAPSSLCVSQAAAGSRSPDEGVASSKSCCASCPELQPKPEDGIEVTLVLIVWGTEKAREGLLLQTYDRVRRLLSRKMVGLV